MSPPAEIDLDALPPEIRAVFEAERARRAALEAEVATLLGYDTAFETARVKRTRVAAPIEARDMDVPTKGRIDLRIRGQIAVDQTLAAGGVHRLSYGSPTLPMEGAIPASARRSVYRVETYWARRFRRRTRSRAGCSCSAPSGATG